MKNSNFLRDLWKSLAVLLALMILFASCGGSAAAPKYTITFDTGIDNITIEPATVEHGTLLKDVPGFEATLSYEGRTFKGWKIDGTDVIPEEYVITSNVSVSAYWTINVTFNANGGKFSNGKTEDIVIEVEPGTAISDLIAFKDASDNTKYKFSGWSINKYNDNEANPVAYDLNNGSDKDITLYAYYITGNFYRVQFIDYNDNNEQVLVYSTEVDAGEKVSSHIKVEDLEKQGYKFVGWYTEDNVKFNDEPVTEDIIFKAVWKKFFTVSFKNAKTEFSKTVLDGEKLPALTTNETNFKNYYAYFMYWSESEENENEAEAKKFDVENTPVTKDMTLYGIYTPKMYSTSINVLENGSIELKLYDYKIYFLKDGAVPGISITYAKTGETPVKLDKTFVKFEERSTFGYVTYSFQTLPSGTYTFTVTNGKETQTQTLTVTEPAPATNLGAVVDDSYVKVTWAKAAGYSYYTVDAIKGDTVVATKTNCTTSAEFFGLENNVEYTFVVKTNGTDKSASVAGTPKITVKKPDWVLAMYMDGDNDLNDSIFADLNEVEYGLYNIRNTNGSPKAGYSDIVAVALWDGWTGDKEETPYFKKSGSYIYELGAEYSYKNTNGTGGQVIGDTYGDYSIFTNLELGSKTKNLSYTAKDWLMDESKTPSNITSSTGGEVNMGSKSTLVNYLKWVNDRYEPTKGIILQFSDHGGGPRSAPNYVELPNGKRIKLRNEGRRALCWDEGSNADFLKTKDVSDAFKEAGFGSSKKLDMIIMDVCLGATIEDAYQFKDYAKYLVASPNTIPSYGLNYNKVMQAFKNTSTVEDIGKQLVKDYASFYGAQESIWNQMAQFMSSSNHTVNTIYDLYDQEYMLLETKYGGMAGVTTMSFIDLDSTKMNTLKNNMNALAEKLISKKDDKIYITEDGKLTTASTTDAIEYSYLLYFRKLLLSMIESPYNDTSLAYQGSYTWLYDAGVLANTVSFFSSESVGPYADSELNGIASDLISSLSDVMVSSWRDTLLSDGTIKYNKYGYYATLDGKLTEDYTGHCFGISVAGYGFAINDAQQMVIPGSVPSWYSTDLDFGKDTKWADLLEELKKQ